MNQQQAIIVQLSTMGIEVDAAKLEHVLFTTRQYVRRIKGSKKWAVFEQNGLEAFARDAAQYDMETAYHNLLWMLAN